MLENSIWRQYNSENNFREKLAEFCKILSGDLIEDDKALYAVMKAKLTKKEMRLFAMDSAGIDNGELKKVLLCSDEELQQAKFKLYKKLKQDKVRLSFKASAMDEE